MNSIDFKFHNYNELSIKDLNGDVNLSEQKWNKLIEYFSKNTFCTYFKGYRINYVDTGFFETINLIGEDILIDEGKDHFRLLLRLKPTVFIFNRILLHKFWLYYEFPSIIFLEDETQESILVETIENGWYNEDIIKNVPGTTIFYLGFELNVLWVKSNTDLNLIIPLLKN
jgi:hypothetical protein